MPIGFPAYYTETRKLNLNWQQVVQVTARALQTLEWSYAQSAPNIFDAKVRVGMWSWGEQIRVTIYNDGTLTVRSECALPTQCFDWGKNSRNAQKLFEQIERFAGGYSHPSTTGGWQPAVETD